MEALTQMLINALRLDATRHEQGEYKNVGSEFEQMECYRSDHPNLPSNENSKYLGIAITFWDSWIDQVRHGFRQNFYPGISPDSWPTLAREIADALESETSITNPLILRHFDLLIRKKSFGGPQ